LGAQPSRDLIFSLAPTTREWDLLIIIRFDVFEKIEHVGELQWHPSDEWKITCKFLPHNPHQRTYDTP